jgi:hypothetical protein
MRDTLLYPVTLSVGVTYVTEPLLPVHSTTKYMVPTTSIVDPFVLRFWPAGLRLEYVLIVVEDEMSEL